MESNLFQCLSSLFHERHRAALTKACCHVMALADPCIYGIGVIFTCSLRICFERTPKNLQLIQNARYGPSRRAWKCWNLHPMSLTHPLTISSTKRYFWWSWWQIYTASQLHALNQQSAWTVFSPDNVQMPLATSPMAFTKNEHEGHILNLTVILSWLVYCSPHSLCSVSTIGSYMRDAPHALVGSLRLCSRSHITLVLRQVIEAADLATAPHALKVHR